jgi:hypothetical protein
MMKPYALGLAGVVSGIVAVASCGGKVSESSDAGSSSGGSGSGGGMEEGSAPIEEAGTAACEIQGLDADADYARCVLCSDGFWHCGQTPDGGPVFPQCPPGTQKGGDCADWMAPAGTSGPPGNCIVNCPGDWTGLGYMCENDGKWGAPDPATCP